MQEESRQMGLTLDAIKAWQPPQRSGGRGARNRLAEGPGITPRGNVAPSADGTLSRDNRKLRRATSA